MSVVTGVLEDLVRRRLWPIAVVLLLALVAVPFLLAKDPEVVATPTAPTTTAAGSPIAALVEDFGTDARRRVLGVPKDPFTPSGRQPSAQADPQPATTADATPPATGGTDPAPGSDPFALPTGGSGAAGGATGGATPVPPTGGTVPPTGGTVPPPSATPAPTAEEEETFDLHSLKVKYDDGETQILKRLAPLPDADEPALIYLGLLRDGKTAVFLLDAGVTSEGDGDCRPSPEDCQRVHLKKGETQFFEFNTEAEDGTGVTAPHQLEIVDVQTKETKSARKARASYASSSKAGRRALRSRVARAGRLRFDARTGLLRRVSLKSHRASLRARQASVETRGAALTARHASLAGLQR